MSSRNQKNFLQLSIATLFLFQFFLMFSPSAASGLLSNIRFESEAKTRIRYEVKITAVNDRVLDNPIWVSQSWNALGIQDYGAAQLLIDELARALDRNDLEKARTIYSELAENHFYDLESFTFEIQQVKITRKPVKSSANNLDKNILAFWSSDLLSTQ